jgi:hypothetical protein
MTTGAKEKHYKSYQHKEYGLKIPYRQKNMFQIHKKKCGNAVLLTDLILRQMNKDATP